MQSAPCYGLSPQTFTPQRPDPELLRLCCLRCRSFHSKTDWHVAIETCFYIRCPSWHIHAIARGRPAEGWILFGVTRLGNVGRDRATALTSVAFNMSTMAAQTTFSCARATYFWFVLRVGTYVFQSEHESRQFLLPGALSCRHSWLSHFDSVTHSDFCSLKITYPTLCNLTKTPAPFMVRQQRRIMLQKEE